MTQWINGDGLVGCSYIFDPTKIKGHEYLDPQRKSYQMEDMTNTRFKQLLLRERLIENSPKPPAQLTAFVNPHTLLFCGFPLKFVKVMISQAQVQDCR